MTDEEREQLTESELEELLDRMFPQGVAGPDVVAEIAPEGWHASPLLACFHPSVEQLYRETLQVHRNVERLIDGGRGAGKPDAAPRPEPTFDEVRAEHHDTPIEVAKEVADLVGMCLWDILSDNHRVIVADGRVGSAGSFRASAGFIDAWISGRAGFAAAGNYLRFYMGTIWIRGRANLVPAYQMIFRRLRALGADWEYCQGKTDEFRTRLAMVDLEARQARLGPPPEVVRGYEIVYGRAPRGWPPR